MSYTLTSNELIALLRKAVADTRKLVDACRAKAGK